MNYVINFDRINREDFNVSSRVHKQIGNVVLITPTPTKHRWTAEDKHLRSLLCRPNGEVISAGFPKFLNYGEDEESDAITREAVLSGRVLWTEKMDGSLLIRSVVDGQVIFRTRGNHELGDFGETNFASMIGDLIREKYPKLLDAQFGTNWSTLFEFVSPQNRIIIRYDDARLIFLANSGHGGLGDTPCYLLHNEWVRMAVEDDVGVPSFPIHDFPNDLDASRSRVAKWSDKEGVVAWCQRPDGSLHLSKIKSDHYKALHSLKFFLNLDRLSRFCFANRIADDDGLAAAFHRAGFDWEIVEYARPIFAKYISRRANVMTRYRAFAREALGAGIGLMTTDKEKAIAIQDLCRKDGAYPDLFPFGIAEAKGKTDLAHEIMDGASIGMSPNQFRVFKANLDTEKNALFNLPPAPDDG